MPHASIPMVDDSRKKPLTQRRIIILGLIFLIFLGAAVLFYKRSGRQMIQNWKAESHLEEAKSLAKDADWEDAFFQAKESLKNKPSLEALRIVVNAAKQIGNSEALPRARQLFRFENADLEDRILALSIALDFRSLHLATAMAGELTPQELQNPEIRFQVVRGFLMTGNYAKALAVANQEVTEENLKIDLLLAASLATSGLKGTKAELNKRLRKLIESEDPVLSLQGFQVLISLQVSRLEKSLVEEAVVQFRDHDSLTPFQQLHLESLKAALGQKTIDKTITDAVAKHRGENLRDLVVWLAKLGRHQKIVDLTEDPQTQLDETVFSGRLSALEKLKDWPTLRASLENPPVTLPEPLHLALQALVDKAENRVSQSNYRWKMAMIAAQSDSQKNWFYDLAQIAGRSGNRDGQMEALVRAITRPGGVPPKANVLGPLFNWLAEQNDEERLLKVSEQLLLREPKHPLLINNFIYLKALYRSAEPKDAEIMTQLVAAYPECAPFPRSLAFIQCVLENYQEALKTLDALPETAQPDASTLAIRARSLFGLGREQEARDLTAMIKWDQLTQKEKDVLQLPEPEEEAGEE